MRSACLYDRLGETLPLMTVGITESTWERTRPLLGLDGAAPGQGLVIEPCSGIHTCGRREAIDVVFLDADWRVLRIVSRLAPWRAAFCGGAARALELGPGQAQRLGLSCSMQLYCLEEAGWLTAGGRGAGGEVGNDLLKGDIR